MLLSNTDNQLVYADEKLLPNVKIHCYYFYLCQSAVWCETQDRSFTSEHKENQHFHLDIGIKIAL